MSAAVNVVEREFDALAEEYESNRLAPWYKAHADFILSHCSHQSGGGLLDIGCASGYFLRRFKVKHPNVQAVGIDLSANMIEQAKKLAAEERINDIRFLQDDWEHLSDDNLKTLQSCHLDTIVCANTLHYFLNPRQALQRIFDLLDTGGRFFLLERDKSHSALTFIWGLLHRYFIKDQVEFYQADQLRSLLQDVGFDQVKDLERIQKYLWKGKLYTSVALIGCRKV